MRSLTMLGPLAATCAFSLWVAAIGCTSGSSQSSAAAQTPACGAYDGGADADFVDGRALTPCAWDAPVKQPSDDTAAANRAACKYARGDMPEATLGPTALPADFPIDNIVVVMMENHSFDSYLGHLNEYGHRSDVESAPAGASNPGVDGGAVPWQHAAHECSLDTTHSWKGTAAEMDDGKMDGFVVTNEQAPPDAGPLPDPTIYQGSRSMWWYDQTDLPLYYQLANTFAVADHYHCSLPGPTDPNRMYLFAATSFGLGGNTLPNLPDDSFPEHDVAVLDELEKRHVNWQLYSDGLPGAATVYATSLLDRWGRQVKFDMATFMSDAKAGKLPSVSFVDPNLTSEMNGGAGQDEHPPGDVQSGEAFVGQVVQAVTTSPQWGHIALFITHDENGGFYDHVPPPPACPPDSLKPVDENGRPLAGAFDIYGIRVILIAVSPYAKKGYVGHHVYDHSSLTRFIEARFKLPALTARDANAEPPTDLFDFTHPSFATPPSITQPTIDPAGLSYCESVFGK